MPFASSVSEIPKQKIIRRFLELYESADELKKLLNSFLSNDSILKTLLDIDSITDKQKIAQILVEYLGLNFLNTAGKNYNVEGLYKKVGIDGKFLIRQKLLEQICKRHYNPEERKKEILNEYNNLRNTKYNEFSELVQDPRFLNWGKSLIKILDFPEITIEPPPKESQEEETTSVSKKTPLKPLYDYQVQAGALISEMLSEKHKEKQKLISIPTGAGKTRLTVEALIDWINNRDQERIPHADDQQKNGRIIFWFASTNELCSQAASEFVNIYSQLGMGINPFNVTRLYGSARRKLDYILTDYPGLHVVVTNTEHFEDELKSEKDPEMKYRIEQYEKSEYFRNIREQTIAIVIDEAHEVTGETYQNFLAAMGFDFSNRIESRGNINRNKIGLIGLTATPYKGSGYEKKEWKCSCGRVFKQGQSREKKFHQESFPSHIITENNIEYDHDLDEFANFDDPKDPDYFKQLDRETKKIHKIFEGVYIPIPEKQSIDSNPIPIIEALNYCYVGDYVKISGLKSFDSYSDLNFEWKITGFGYEPHLIHNQKIFYHKFETEGTHHIKLTVINQQKKSESVIHTIDVYPSKKSKEMRRGNLPDNKEFNLILQERKILCEIVYGVIDGPQLEWNEKEIERWRRGTLSEENERIIEKAVEYNKHICDIVDKCFRNHERKKILIFASSVNHAQNLALILHVKYGLRAKYVDSKMNPGLRRQTIREFREDQIDVLCNYGILTTGFDVPKIDTLLICRDVGSNALYTQMIGRGQRGLIVGGTNELWLITAHFKKGAFEEGGVLRLGWEALVDTWKKFPVEIKNDLKVRDNVEYVFEVENSKLKDTSKPPEINPQIVSYSPLKLKCLTCNEVKEGLANIIEFFKAEGSREVIQHAIQNGTFPKNCYQCRKLISIEKESKCIFCKSFVQNNDHDPVFAGIADFAFHSQLGKGKNNFKDLQDWLYEKFNKNVQYDFFGLTNPTVKKIRELGLLVIKNNLEIEFIKISDFTTLKELIDFEYKTQELKNKEQEILDKYKIISINTSSSNVDKIKTLFNELKNYYGHIPTTRQFKISIQEKNMWTEFIKEYGGIYKKFLSFHREFIEDDQNLKDLLYDEYFEKCISVRGKINHEQLDKQGQYRIIDYEDVFGTFGEFEEKTKNDLKHVLENVDEKRKESNKEFEEISKDLKTVRRILGRIPHYEEIRIHSGIGVYRYLIQIKISYLQYLRNYEGEHIGAFLRLVNEFFRLKRVLMTTPTGNQFCNTRLISVESLSDYGKLFKFNYNEFLKTINVKPVEKIPIEHIEKMKKETMEKLNDYKAKHGKEKLFELIDSTHYSNDELSISVNAWIEDKKSLKKQFE